MLMLNEKEGLSVKLEWFNHLPIYNDEDLAMEFKEQKFPQCMNCPNLNVQPRELHAFEKYPFITSFL